MKISMVTLDVGYTSLVFGFIDHRQYDEVSNLKAFLILINEYFNGCIRFRLSLLQWVCGVIVQMNLNLIVDY